MNEVIVGQAEAMVRHVLGDVAWEDNMHPPQPGSDGYGSDISTSETTRVILEVSKCFGATQDEVFEAAGFYFASHLETSGPLLSPHV
jgi:hypothetical protein